MTHVGASETTNKSGWGAVSTLEHGIHELPYLYGNEFIRTKWVLLCMRILRKPIWSWEMQTE